MIGRVYFHGDAAQLGGETGLSQQSFGTRARAGNERFNKDLQNK
jgi:hypothetical protein